MNTIINLFLLFMIFSFFGWCMEVVVTFIVEKKLINRGFLIGPLCPIYGVGVLLIKLLLQRYMYDPLVLFIMAVVICSLLEYFTSYIMEKLFKARWWDYTNKKFNINGRICLENLIAFGLLGLVVMYVFIPFLLRIFLRIPTIILIIITIFLLILFIVDVVISFKVISGFKNVAKSMKKDNTEEITKKVKELLLNRGGLYKRLILAFKDFQASERLLRITDKIKKSANSALDKLDILDMDDIKILKNDNNKKNKPKKKEKETKLMNNGNKHK